jgi:hypothetical protein
MRGGFSKIVADAAQFLRDGSGDLAKFQVSEGVACLIYSDNLYVISRPDNAFLSLDGSKMEATITPEIINLEAERILVAAGAGRYTENGSSFIMEVNQDSRVSTGWAYYVRCFHNLTVANSVAVLGNTQTRITGQASGNASTFAYNTAQMSLLYLLLKLGGVTGPVLSAKAYERVRTESTCSLEDLKTEALSDIWRMACVAAGVQIKVELVTTRIPELLDYGTNVVIPMDILGFDCRVMFIEGKPLYIPVLNRSRLLKAALFDKTEYDHSFKDKRAGAAIKSFVAYVKAKSLFLMGGWDDPVLSLSLMIHAIGSVKALSTALGVNTDQSTISEALVMLMSDLTQDDANEMSRFLSSEIFQSMMNSSLLPTLSDVMKVLLHEDDLITWQAYIFSLVMQGTIPLGEVAKYFSLDTFATVLLNNQHQANPEWAPTRVSDVLGALGEDKMAEILHGASELRVSVMNVIPAKVMDIIYPSTVGTLAVPTGGVSAQPPGLAPAVDPKQIRKEKVFSGKAELHTTGPGAGVATRAMLEDLLKRKPDYIFKGHLSADEIKKYKDWINKRLKKSGTKKPNNRQKLEKYAAESKYPAFDASRREDTTISIPAGLVREKMYEATAFTARAQKKFIKSVWGDLESLVAPRFKLYYQPYGLRSIPAIIGEGVAHEQTMVTQDVVLKNLYKNLSSNPLIKHNLHVPDYKAVLDVARNLMIPATRHAQDIAGIMVAKSRLEDGADGVRALVENSATTFGAGNILRDFVRLLRNSKFGDELGITETKKNILLEGIEDEFEKGLKASMATYIGSWLTAPISPGILDGILSVYLRNSDVDPINISRDELIQKLEGDKDLMLYILASNPPPEEVMTSPTILDKFVSMRASIQMAGCPVRIVGLFSYLLKNINGKGQGDTPRQLVENTYTGRLKMLYGVPFDNLPAVFQRAVKLYATVMNNEIINYAARYFGVKLNTADVLKMMDTDPDTLWSFIKFLSIPDVNVVYIAQMKVMIRTSEFTPTQALKGAMELMDIQEVGGKFSVA